MKKINFKQPKYIFPAVIFVPLLGLTYFISSIFSGSDDTSGMHNELNASIPEAHTRPLEDKLSSMTGRFDLDESYTAIYGIDKETQRRDTVEQVYSDDELNAIDARNAERERVRKESEALEKRLRESTRHQNSVSYASGSDYDEQSSYMNELADMKRRSDERRKAYNKVFGIEDEDEKAAKADQERIAELEKQRKIQEERERTAPKLVVKSRDVNYSSFNTVTDVAQKADEPLIKAMIDKSTKVRDGTRIRFKLLDDVSVDGTALPKGTYLYGTVTGFQQQRVMATITSILIGDKFRKVNLSVFDNDGMEGFYVPASDFREFVKDASAQAVNSNINFNSNTGYGNGISGEAIALQALQNVYSSATNAISSNMRMNKAKIKYNTVVYLINGDNAR